MALRNKPPKETDAKAFLKKANEVPTKLSRGSTPRSSQRRPLAWRVISERATATPQLPLFTSLRIRTGSSEPGSLSAVG